MNVNLAKSSNVQFACGLTPKSAKTRKEEEKHSNIQKTEPTNVANALLFGHFDFMRLGRAAEGRAALGTDLVQHFGNNFEFRVGVRRLGQLLPHRGAFFCLEK